MKKIIVLSILTALLAGCASTQPTTNASGPQQGQSRFGIGVEFFVDVPTSTLTSTPTIPAPTQPPAPTPTPTQNASVWICGDPYGQQSEAYGLQTKPCVGQDGYQFNITITNASLATAWIGSVKLDIVRDPRTAGCMRTANQCTYTVQLPTTFTDFGDAAQIGGVYLSPINPDEGVQGYPITLTIIPDGIGSQIHKVSVEP